MDISTGSLGKLLTTMTGGQKPNGMMSTMVMIGIGKMTTLVMILPLLRQLMKKMIN